MKLLCVLLFGIFIMSCGDRKEKEKEVVFNDPRFGEPLPVNGNCTCHCTTRNCNECRTQYPGCNIKIDNNNYNKNACDQKVEAPKAPRPQPPIIIINQSQDQDQNQQSDNNNDINNTNTNDNKSTIAIIGNRQYKCWKYKKGCGTHGMSCGSSAQTVIPMDQDYREVFVNGDKLECFSTP